VRYITGVRQSSSVAGGGGAGQEQVWQGSKCQQVCLCERNNAIGYVEHAHNGEY